MNGGESFRADHCIHVQIVVQYREGRYTLGIAGVSQPDTAGMLDRNFRIG